MAGTLRALVALVAMLSPLSAQAAITVLGWGPSTSVAQNSVNQMQRGGSVYLAIPANTDAVTSISFPLDLKTCGGPVNLFLNGDVATTGVGAEVTLYDCEVMPIVQNQCSAIAFDSNADGIPNTSTMTGVTATGMDRLYGVYAKILAVTVTTTTKNGWLRVTCPWKD